MSLLIILLLPFAGSAVAALLPTNARNLESLWAATVALAVVVPLALRYPQVADGGVVMERLRWLPGLGVDLVVRLDGFAWMFAMLLGTPTDRTWHRPLRGGAGDPRIPQAPMHRRATATGHPSTARGPTRTGTPTSLTHGRRPHEKPHGDTHASPTHRRSATRMTGLR